MTYLPTMPVHLEYQKKQAIIYLRYSLAFLILAFLSQEIWLTRLCTCLLIVTSFRAITLFIDVMFDDAADAIFGPLELADDEFSPLKNMPPN